MKMTSQKASRRWIEDTQEKLESSGQWQTLLDKLNNCTTNIERLDLIGQLDGIDKLVKTDGRPDSKCEEEAVHYREAGNTLFQSKQFVKALKHYNRSIMLSPIGQDSSTTLGLALANRSAVLYHLQRYNECLNDISAAKRYGYPDKLWYKLLERRGKCWIQLNEPDKAKEAFDDAKTAVQSSTLDNNKINTILTELGKQIQKSDKPTTANISEVLLSSPLPKFSSKLREGALTLNSALALGYSKESGRGVYATRDIDVGDVLIIERPYTSTVLSNLKNTYCHHCCGRVIAPVPCLSCSGVLFCNETCRQDAWDSYHKIECKVLHRVRGADINLGHLSFKMVLKAGVEKLAKLTEAEDCTELQRIDLMGAYDTEEYESVYLLVNHAEDRNKEDLLKHSLQAYYLLMCMKGGCEEVKLGEKEWLNVGAHLLRNLMMLPCNAHECSELLYKENNLPESITVEIGSAIYPFLSLINHSCDPNVVRHSYKNVCVVRAIRNISKGSEVLDNYGALCALTPTKDRREKLEGQYYFTCHCEACVDDFPQYTDLPTDTPVFRCDKCSGPVFLPLKGGYNEVLCSFCKHPHDITPRIGLLGQSDEVYRVAMMDVLTSSCVNLDENISTLEGHLQLMDKVLCRPWRDYNDCQEALKQCYACKASHVPVNLA